MFLDSFSISISIWLDVAPAWQYGYYMWLHVVPVWQSGYFYLACFIVLVRLLLHYVSVVVLS